MMYRSVLSSKNILLLCFRGISYSWHEVTYLSVRKLLRSCAVVVKNSSVTAPEKNGSHESGVFRKNSLVFCKNILSFLFTYHKIAQFFYASCFKRITFYSCRLIKPNYLKDTGQTLVRKNFYFSYFSTIFLRYYFK